MRLAIVVSLVLLAAVAGCSQTGPSRNANAWPSDWSALVGKTVTVQGFAANAKLGAILLDEDDHSIWIDGMDSWPDSVCPAGPKGKRVHVTGTVIRRGDLPAFVPKDGEPQKTGIPVERNEQIEEASTRFLLTDVKWTVAEDK